MTFEQTSIVGDRSSLASERGRPRLPSTHAAESAGQRALLSLCVVIIVHKEPPSIDRLIASIRAQSCTGAFDIMILDDGTSPRALQYLRNAAREEPKIHIHLLPHNCNLSAAKNAAVHLSNSDLLLFIDDRMTLACDAISELLAAFRRYPDLAGACGFYSTAHEGDYNTLRDIKRQTIYGKKLVERMITLDDFTTFSTGIGAIRRDLLTAIPFPERDFPNDFGGEDIPVIITALNRGRRLLYTPSVRATHEHDMNLGDIARKMEVEVRGRFSLLYWASNNPQLRIPYLQFFLSFPLFFLLSLFTVFIHPAWLILPACLAAYELVLAGKCLRPPTKHEFTTRTLAFVYVVASEVLTALCALQYCVSRFKRPFRSIRIGNVLLIIRTMLLWELKKYRLPGRGR